LDDLFAARARRASIVSEPTMCGDIELAAQALIDELRARIRDIRPTDYIAAKGFVQRLAYEARCARDRDALALNDMMK
jgi:hypothetical protein